MKVRFLLLLCLIGIVLSAKAQSDYRSGFIITNEHDTIYGDIDYRGDQRMSTICSFKNEQGDLTKYSPYDIYGYRFIDSKYFISKAIDGRKVFLEYLIKGEVNIYYSKDEQGEHYYIDKAGEKISELPYTSDQIISDEGKRVQFESTRHMGILSYYMQDAPDFRARIETVKEPGHQNLIKLAEDYHNTVCDGDKCIIYEKKLPLIKFSLAPVIGIRNYRYANAFLFETGGYIYFNSPRANEKLFLKTGVVVSYLEGTNSSVLVSRIPIQLQYIYNVHKLQPKVSFGFNLFKIKSDYVIGIEHRLSLNTGLNYQLNEKLSIASWINTDYTPILLSAANNDLKFGLESYAIHLGIRIDL